ncbi:hypothetical protein ASPFODRAFT_606754 [Aspergillus luchuensis CBS 106.47]|uniref:Uncharacterized protein n=1 Tax=Aspergillus luchuensis (strain CBS 106.47) TaxID=1137211 RepID=A0A1M3TIM0_ASPLC|nr:hypothetical protein ASPFODRAFT_606754 [Aspergillus luchuensis CBS 106.47]
MLGHGLRAMILILALCAGMRIYGCSRIFAQRRHIVLAQYQHYGQPDQSVPR